MIAAALRVALAAAVASSPAFVIRDSRITESSGLVASPTHDGSYWTMNDSGDSSRTFALDAEGRTIGVWRWDVAKARDWEAIAAQRLADGTGVLWAGDIGDNGGSRTGGILVHRAVEPRTLAGGGTLEAQSYRLRFADGPHDAEAMFVGRDGRLRIVSKEILGGTVYIAPRTLSTDKANVLTAEHDAPPIVTDGAELPDGSYVLRDYGAVYVYSAQGDLLGTEDLPSQQQGESVAVVDGGRALLVGSEGRNSPVLRVPVPVSSSAATEPADPSSPPAATPATPADSATADTFGDLGRILVGVAVGAGVVLGVLLILLVGLGVRSGRRRR